MTLYGKQEPRFSSVPPYSVTLGDDAVEFAAKAGLHLDPWQQMVLRESMGLAKGGKWAAPRVGLLVPRQNGKGSVLEALELFHMFVLNTPLIVHSAHKFDTSQEHFLRLRTLIEGNPDLDRHVKAAPTSTGHEAIILRNGNRLKFKARTVGGAGRGFSADLLVLDEAM
ncbi:MAG: terminase TerL endonuclease subunit, partial [Mycobacteriaceae bacterium]